MVGVRRGRELEEVVQDEGVLLHPRHRLVQQVLQGRGLFREVLASYFLRDFRELRVGSTALAHRVDRPPIIAQKRAVYGEI